MAKMEKNHCQQIKILEATTGAIQEKMTLLQMKMHRWFEQLIKMHKEFNRMASASTTGKENEPLVA